jgi:NAD-dependent SIR2 family protein deacetylase
MDSNSAWVQVIINILGAVFFALLSILVIPSDRKLAVAILVGLAALLLLTLRLLPRVLGWLRRGIFHESLAPLRLAYSRFLLRRMSPICVAANVADAHWDKCVASHIIDFLYRGKPYLPIFLPRDPQEWASFWEAVGERSSTLTPIILGSKKRFEFTKYVLTELQTQASTPGNPVNLLDYKKGPAPLHIPFSYPDEAEVIVARRIKLVDSFQNAHQFRKIILMSGESGPATLAACHAYLANPRAFEPPPEKIVRVSTLKLTVRYKTNKEMPGSYDYRYVDPDSIELDTQFDLPGNRETGVVWKGQSLQPLYRNIELPPKRGKDDPHYYSPRKFLTAVEDLHKFREDVEDGDRQLVRWGWKRDSDDGRWTRVIYLSAFLVFDGTDLVCVDPYFHLYHRGEKDAIKTLLEKCEAIRTNNRIKFPIGLETSGEALTLRIGRPRVHDSDLIAKLIDRRPDPPQPRKLLKPVEIETLLDYTPCDLYVGSGLSYEAGVPKLRELHMKFHVDDGASTFKFAREDGLINEIQQNFERAFKGMLMVDIAYIKARPTESHRKIKELRDDKCIWKVYSDNVDDLLERAGIETIPTRGNGLFNEEFKVGADAEEEDRLSDSKKVPYLWVVGVSADRRGIIRQARMQKHKIVVINPDEPVSPRSKRLDYLEEGDVFIKKRFEEVRDLL